jgi:uncharacterized membrane protein YraQ (UPF0718 family)
MCECGAVVVIRRFLAKGLPVSCAVTYMLAAPIVSPLVALSTFAAFRSQSPWLMTSLRLALGYLIAVSVGLVVQRLRLGAVLQATVIESLPEQRLVRAAPARALEAREARLPGSGGARSSSRAGLRIATAAVTGDFGTEWEASGVWASLLRVVQSATADFLDVALYFVIGAAVAATFNTAVNQEIIHPLAAHSAAAILTMMGLAGAMALCSSTDAFIAASFITFPFASKLAFLVFGPVFDVKLFFLYGLVFRRKFIVGLAIGLFITIALLCLRLSVYLQ